MEKYFVTYNQSLALKELGFDEPCIGKFDTQQGGEWFLNIYSGHLNVQFNDKSKACIAPLKSQAFEFFREKYGLHSFVDIYPTKEEPNRCWFMIRYIDRSIEEEEDYMSGWFSCQDKAEIYCLDKLIEIVKNK